MPSSTFSLLQRLLCSAVIVALGSTAAPAAAAAPTRSKTPTAAAPVTTDGKTVALFRFSGEIEELLVRDPIREQLEASGYTVRPVALDLATAAEKVKCQDVPTADTCLDALGKWLRANPKTAADFIVVGVEVDGRAEIIVFDINRNDRVDTLRFEPRANDIILPAVLPRTVVKALDDRRTPPPGATPEEQAIIAALDEPEKTAEELAAEQREIDEAEAEAAKGVAEAGGGIPDVEVEVDLRADFKEFCRTGKRNKRESRSDPKDLRPKCQLGPVWGYWQPRAWVALALAGGAGVATIAFYGAALAARSDYSDAVDAVEDYVDDVGGDPRTDPTVIVNGDRRYDVLATEVSRTGAIVRERAIVGDALLATTALVTVVLAVIISQDRAAAREFIKGEKQTRAISNLRVAPMMTRGTGGFSLGFDF